MKDFCQNIPFVKGKKDTYSKLFTDLNKIIKDHDTVIDIYGISTSTDFIETYKDRLIFDVNGEPTIESVLPLINTREIKDPAFIKYRFTQQLNQNTQQYDITSIVEKAVNFNKDSVNYAAVVVTDKTGRSTINVVERNDEVNFQVQQLQKCYNAFKKIDSFLKSKGVTIKWLNSDVMHNEDGLMIPENLRKASTGLFGVINLANNFAGYKVLTEEFSHFIIENLKSNRNIQRAEQLLSDNPHLIRDILGDEYDTVVQYYTDRNRTELIAREALGRLMAQAITNNIEPDNSIFQRVKNAIRNFINQFLITTKEKQSLDTLKSDIAEILNDVWTNDAINDTTLEFFSRFGDTLAHATTETSYITHKIQDAKDHLIANMLKYVQVYKPRVSLSDEESTEIDINAQVKHQLDVFMNDLKEHSMMESMNNFANEAIVILNRNLQALRDIANMKSFTFKQIRNKASVLTQIKNLVETYREPIIDYWNVCEEIIKNPEGSEVAKNNAQLLQNLLSTVQSLLASTENVFVNTNRSFLYFVLKPYFEKDGIKYIDQNGRERIVTLSQVIDMSMGDISILNRCALAAANTDDLWVQLVDYYIQQQKERARQATLLTDHRVTTMDRVLRLSGMQDTSWMYVKSNGTPTGFLISQYDYIRFKEERNKEKQRLSKLGLSEDEQVTKLKIWDDSHTESYKVTREYTTKSGEVKTWTREYRVPIYKSNALNNLTSEQRKYYDAYLKIKHEMDWYLPQTITHPFLAIQMRMGSVAEALLTSKQGIMGGFVNSLNTLKNDWLFLSDFDYGEYGPNMTLMQKLQDRLNSTTSFVENTTLRFDNTPYRTVPIYFVKPLDDMKALSTDATTALREYVIMATNYHYMHSCVDIIELIREQNKVRQIKDVKQHNMVTEQFKYGDESVTRDASIPTTSSNVYKRVEELIDMNFYDITKAQGSAITEKLTTAKLADLLIKYSSFSMLGYNLYSATNNITAGKYQLFIEATGGEYFNHYDLMKAEKEYWKMIPKFLADIYKPHSVSKLQLLMEMFNIGQHWKENIRSSRAYKKALHAAASKSVLNSSFMLEMGEHNIQTVGALAFLIGYKLYKGPIVKDERGRITNKEYVSLYDALSYNVVKDSSGNVIDATLKFDDKYKDYVNKDNQKLNLSFGSQDLTNLTLLIGKVNQDMQGIYNTEDQMVAQMYAVGRFAALYRRHIVPQMQKRFKSFGKGRGVYNFKSKQIEEGYYVTFMRTMIALLLPMKSHYYTADQQQELGNFLSRWHLLKDSILTTHQKSNLKRFVAEMGLLLTLSILSAILNAGLDKDEKDPWTHRQLLYQMKRLELDGTAYFPPSMVSSLLNILVSPTAVISPLQKWVNVVQAIPNRHKILKSGPYKGHSRLYAEFMRALPIYPHVYSFVTLNKNDSRFKIFDKTLLESTIYNALMDENSDDDAYLTDDR